MKKAVKISPLMTPSRKSNGVEYAGMSSGFEAVVIPGVSITVTRIEGHDAGTGRTFLIGDMAEYDSFNLSYFGPILAITDKAVTIRNKHSEKKHRLNLYNFAWRNYKFNADTESKKNLETMMYI